MLVSGKYNEFGFNSLYCDGIQIDISEAEKIGYKSQGFTWGYIGQGPSATAAIILYKVGGRSYVEKYHDIFRREYILKIKSNSDFSIDSEVIEKYIKKK